MIITVLPSKRNDLKTLSSTGGLGARIDFRVPFVVILDAERIWMWEDCLVNQERRFMKMIDEKPGWDQTSKVQMIASISQHTWCLAMNRGHTHPTCCGSSKPSRHPQTGAGCPLTVDNFRWLPAGLFKSGQGEHLRASQTFSD